MTALLRALGVDRGIVAAVGAGGKKSLLYAIAADAPGRVAWTATVHTPRPPRWTGMEINVASARELIRQAAVDTGAPIRAFLQPSEKTGRVAGLAPEQVESLHAAGGFDLTLVKADGARMRGIKAPKPGEPVVPRSAAKVLVVVSAAVLGQPLDQRIAHRPERVAEIAGLAIGQPIGPEHMARMFSAEHGLLQGTEFFDVCAVINQVDDERLQREAEAAAFAMLEASPALDRVVLTCLGPGRDPDRSPVGIIRRAGA
ncbi:MAG: putative selenium-dependent hydroxylase accessory protein YqeC [Xanthomonadales bacterium]|nr:putative selenium-dependent hydroxylase accessory protein YqeC [Xanthomonadales bacterium]